MQPVAHTLRGSSVALQDPAAVALVSLRLTPARKSFDVAAPEAGPLRQLPS